MIRKSVIGGENANEFVPEKAGKIYSTSAIADAKRIENAILYKMKTTTPQELAKAPDVSEGIENRIVSAAKQAVSLDELYALAKTKRYSHARIRRIIINHFLTVTADDLRIPVPYIKVLGFNSKGAELLKVAKNTALLPVVTKASDIGNIGEDAQRIFSLECTAGDIFALCMENSSDYTAEKDCRPVII